MDVDFDENPFRILVHFFDDLRVVFNRSLDHLEPWQVISYTLAVTFLVQWIRKVMKIDDATSVSRSWHNLMMLTTTFYRDRIEEQKQEMQKEIEEKMLRSDIRREFYKFLPEKGLSVEEIISEATEYKTMGDPLFERGRVSGASFADDTDDQKQLMMKVFEMYSHTNANFPDIYPGCRKMESEIIRMLCALFHGSARACGVVTTSGTESIILACIAYRNLAAKRGIRKPEIIIGRNADVTLTIAAKLLNLRTVSIPMDQNGQMDLTAIKRSIGLETCMIVCSAPSYISGVMDDIERISELGLRYNVPVHVDASLGGFLLPFMEQCDYPAPQFDFRLSGVTSISVDLHKYAYCPIGSSVVLYRDIPMLQAQVIADCYWPGGIFCSPTLSGSRPGSLLALTWASLLWNGRLGFVERTQRVLDAAHMLREKLDQSPHVEVIGNPVLASLAFKTKNPKVNCYVLGDLLNELGWNLAFVQKPEALRFCVSLKQTSPEVINEFVDDLNRSCERIEKNADNATVPKMLVFYGISSSFTDRGIAEDLPSLFIDTYYSTPLRQNRSTRTLSIEGRKLSSMQSPSESKLTALREQFQAGRFSSNLTPHIE
ncbi:hypothetical protein M3Y98_00203200 [Aphelenchoides besseyi]|nr:hypothetical protein M3Y98_00203200 [Aphelenchoides besseyi]